MKSKYILSILLTACLFQACQKYLDVEPKGKLIPTTAADFRKLLDNTSAMNLCGALPEFATGDVIITDAMFNQLFSASEKNTYTWARDIYDPAEQGIDWSIPSKQIYNSNLVLEGLEQDKGSSPLLKNTLKGEAFFYRAFAVYNMATTYADVYTEATAQTRLGVPYRSSPDVFVISTRPSLKETYDHILADFTQAVDLLPLKADVLTRPSKEAALGMLARVYLDMGSYEQAKAYAVKALEISDVLLDFKTISPSAYPRFKLFNEEYLFFTFSYYDYSYYYFGTMSRSLFDLFEPADLRKTLFFNVSGSGAAERITFTGSYSPEPYNFAGLARDEIYLIAAEGYARNNETSAALQYLNKLLEKRYTAAGFVPLALSGDALLARILTERRKELIYRNRRWTYLKRLNTDPRYAVTLTRTVAGTTYTLAPGDPRYVYPIPKPVIDATGMPQNIR